MYRINFTVLCENVTFLVTVQGLSVTLFIIIQAAVLFRLTLRLFSHEKLM